MSRSPNYLRMKRFCTGLLLPLLCRWKANKYKRAIHWLSAVLFYVKKEVSTNFLIILCCDSYERKETDILWWQHFFQFIVHQFCERKINIHAFRKNTLYFPSKNQTSSILTAQSVKLKKYKLTKTLQLCFPSQQN